MDPPAELSYAKCRELLGGGVFGRVAVCTPKGPRILPVNYSVVNEAVVFRTSATGVVADHEWGSPIAFEVDHVDYVDQKGWSVLVTGRGQRVTDAVELAHIRRTWDPRPWAGGSKPLYVRLAWDELTGRRLGQGWTHTNEIPVRRRL
ncbi:MAG: pyridoxamine 5-phosphate oxidase-related, FMN-binding protein [Marmoricola sp.]|nr:pyridoxamine 5-phosphate oxidase-related, FMN-binding protein [Marmoricola sp.]